MGPAPVHLDGETVVDGRDSKTEQFGYIARLQIRRATEGDIWTLAAFRVPFVAEIRSVDESSLPESHDRVLQALVTNLYVRSGYRGRVVGRRLMRVCIDHAAQSRVRALGLHTTADGRKLYESVGILGQPSWLELAVDQL